MECVSAEVKRAGIGKAVRAVNDTHFQAGQLLSRNLGMQKLDGCKGWCPRGVTEGVKLN